MKLGRIVGLGIVGPFHPAALEDVLNAGQAPKHGGIDLESPRYVEPVHARSCRTPVRRVGRVYGRRAGPGVHRDKRHPPRAVGLQSRPTRIRGIGTDAGVKEPSLRHFFERRQDAGWAEVEGMVVGERQGVEADILQRIQHHGGRTAEEGTFHRPSAMPAEHRRLEIGEGDIGLPDQRRDRGKSFVLDLPDIMMNERLPGQDERER